jgi:hypothetical protein
MPATIPPSQTSQLPICHPEPEEKTVKRILPHLSHAVAAVIPLALLPWVSVAQQVPERIDVFPEPFSRVVGIRALSDGRVLIADGVEKYVSFISFDSGTLETIGREGEGPGEYSQPSGLYPFPDNGTLLADIGNMRLTRIDRAGHLSDSWPMMRQDAGAPTFIRPGGTDSKGRVYFSSAGLVMRGPGAPAAPSDSIPLMRFDPAAQSFDTVATLYQDMTPSGGRGGTMKVAGGGSFTVAGTFPRPYAPRDGWAVTPEGRVAVVRSVGYRLDWYDPTGKQTVGPTTPYDPVQVTTAEKNAWADRMAQASMSFRMAGRGSQTMRMQRPDPAEVEFPEFMPPFDAEGVLVTPDGGEVWVRLNQPSSERRPLFDVFDARGAKIKRVRFPAGREVVGFGLDVVYVVSIDEDDLQWLERYRR